MEQNNIQIVCTNTWNLLKFKVKLKRVNIKTPLDLLYYCKQTRNAFQSTEDKARNTKFNTFSIKNRNIKWKLFFFLHIFSFSCINGEIPAYTNTHTQCFANPSLSLERGISLLLCSQNYRKMRQYRTNEANDVKSAGPGFILASIGVIFQTSII